MKSRRNPKNKLKKRRMGSHKRKTKTPAKKRQSKATKIWWTKYNTYLKSDKWKAKREELFELRGKKCERCRSTKRIQVHHLSYKHVFNEPIEDLMVVCHKCHEKIHNRKL